MAQSARSTKPGQVPGERPNPEGAVGKTGPVRADQAATPDGKGQASESRAAAQPGQGGRATPEPRPLDTQQPSAGETPASAEALARLFRPTAAPPPEHRPQTRPDQEGPGRAVSLGSERRGLATPVEDSADQATLAQRRALQRLRQAIQRIERTRLQLSRDQNPEVGRSPDTGNWRDW